MLGPLPTACAALRRRTQAPGWTPPLAPLPVQGGRRLPSAVGPWSSPPMCPLAGAEGPQQQN